MNKIFAALLALIIILSLAACSSEAGSAGSPDMNAGVRIVTDVWGRQVEIPVKVETIITLGSGAPRLAAYLDVMDMLVGAEEYDAREDVVVIRDYHPVYHAVFLTLPIVGAGGGSGNNNGFPEEIIQLAPDVILAGFDLEAADELQAQTGIPVVSVRHTTGLATESFTAAMRVFAEVVGAQERCEMILTYIDAAKEDLQRRTSGISDGEKAKAYAGAVTWNGRRGFAGTYSVFGIFDAINARNAAYDASIDGFYEADLESIVMWDPDIIFLDPGNMDLVNDEYRTNPNYFDSLRSVREGRVFTLPAFNFSGTNITYALMNAYYAGIVLFPEQFADVDITEKSAEILTLFLGMNTYDAMAEGGLYYGKITIGE